MGKMISRKGLELSLDLLEKYEQQIKLAEELKKGTEARKATIMEFIRANFTGDDEAFKAIRTGFLAEKGSGSTRRYYDRGIMDSMKTKQVVQRVRELLAVDQSTVGDAP